MRNLFRAAMLIVFFSRAGYGHEGWGIVVHERLGVVVSDIPSNTIWRIHDNGIEPLIRHVHSHELIAGSGGAIFGVNPETDGSSSSVWRIDGAGRFSYLVTPVARYPLGLQSFLTTTDGTIYSVNRYDYRKPTVILLRRDPDGRIVGIAGGAKGFSDGVGANARFSGIDGMRELADGSLLVADGAYVRKVTRDGRVSTVTEALTQRRWDEDLLGLSTITNGTVYVADHSGRRVLRVTLAGGKSEEVVKSGFLWAPAGVESNGGALYVLEHLRPPLSLLGDLQIGPYLRVRRIERGGSGKTLALVWGRNSRRVSAVLALLLVLMWWLIKGRRRGRR